MEEALSCYPANSSTLMGKQYPTISADTQAFIERQHVFFVGTAAADGRVNISPKGQDTLRVLDANRVAWLNLTGSGNETAAHLLEVNRITLMWCAFEGNTAALPPYPSRNSSIPNSVCAPRNSRS
ncbi:pyridoxamine 5'-phosphate oxidase family protein [Hymenobacter glacieicola]|uniref:Pyridoxamine 5'-phosphate oxidase N-terminal domain-containing protein n=1 Tax=Hymenobacter glacieicola TaxID=1562124 RepID=A0ABQ1X5Q1_9BACT|nr:pyridoxamine 5'-phosphate oxidase family protein [Hymenobacter glacieicola]GGG57408.1 hypothetical protein GCM10011378_36850 [Hymenobacter glacieicola]